MENIYNSINSLHSSVIDHSSDWESSDSWNNHHGPMDRSSSSSSQCLFLIHRNYTLNRWPPINAFASSLAIQSSRPCYFWRFLAPNPKSSLSVPDLALSNFIPELCTLLDGVPQLRRGVCTLLWTTESSSHHSDSSPVGHGLWVFHGSFAAFHSRSSAIFIITTRWSSLLLLLIFYTSSTGGVLEVPHPI